MRYRNGKAAPAEGGSPRTKPGSNRKVRRNVTGSSGPKRTYYAYHDKDSQSLFRSVRTEPGRDGGGKSFHQEYRREDGAWIRGLPEQVRRVPFHLPQLLAGIAGGDTVYVAEGEKDVLTLEAWDCVATTNPMGAGKWLDEYAQFFRGAKEVVVIADNDHRSPLPHSWRGYLHGESVRDSIASVISPERVTFKMPADGLKDITDHFHSDHSMDELVRATPPAGIRPGKVSRPGFRAVLVPWPSGGEKETARHGKTEEVLRGAPPSGDRRGGRARPQDPRRGQGSRDQVA